jgi:hypothetical protein
MAYVIGIAIGLAVGAAIWYGTKKKDLDNVPISNPPGGSGSGSGSGSGDGSGQGSN